MAGPEVSADELDLLADLDAGLLEGEERRRAEALARTDRGRRALHALARVRGELAALPEPPVPAALDEWVLGALSAVPAVAPFAGAASRGRGPNRRSPRRRVWAWTASGAAAVVLVGSALGTGLVRPGDGVPTAASGGGAVADGSDGSGRARSGSAGPEAAPAGAGQPRPARAGAAEPAPAAGGQGDGGSGPTRDRPVGGDALLALTDVPVLASGRDYSAGDLPVAALDLAERTRRPDVSTGSPATDLGTDTVPQELVRLRDPGQLAACLTSLAGSTVRPLVVDLARLEGQPALVAVLPGRQGQPVVHVAGPDCAVDEPDRRTGTAPAEG